MYFLQTQVFVHNMSSPILAENSPALYWKKIWGCQKRIRGLHWKIPGATAPQFQLASYFQENTQDSTVTKQNPNCKQWETKIFRKLRSQDKKLLKTFFSVTFRLLGLSQMDETGKSETQARQTHSVIFVALTVETLKWNELFYLLFANEFPLEQAELQYKFSGPHTAFCSWQCQLGFRAMKQKFRCPRLQGCSGNGTILQFYPKLKVFARAGKFWCHNWL